MLQTDSDQTGRSSSWRKECGGFLFCLLLKQYFHHHHHHCRHHLNHNYYIGDIIILSSSSFAIIIGCIIQVSNEIEQHVWVVEEDGKFLKLLEVLILSLIINSF